MQKEYVILNKDQHSPVMVSIHSLSYPELLQIGYTVLYQGNRKQCLEIMREQEMELSY